MPEDFQVTSGPGLTGPGLPGRTLVFRASQVTAIVDGAIRCGKIPPWRRDYYLARLGAGGRAGGEAVATLVMLTPAPPDIAAAWDRDPRTIAAAAPGSGPGQEQIWRALYPGDEAHTHPHGHGNDASHQVAVADPAAAGIAASRAARLAGDPSGPAGLSDDQLYAEIFGPDA